MSVKRLVPLNTVELANNPATGRIGDIYYNTTSQELRVYTGTDWISVGGNQTGILEHIHTYDGDIYSVGSFNVQSTNTIDGGLA
jgi:hypothetical protein